MAKHILIDSGFGLIRTALTVHGKLVDYYEESPDLGRSKGNIYKGIIKKVDPHIQAAFVRYSGGRDGFLPLRDVPFRTEDGGGSKKKSAIGPGDPVVVQVVKDEVGGKGAALTTKLSLSGRYLVYMPDSDGDGGVSSRLSDEERAAMKKALSELRIPDGAAVILRTAALNHPTEELQADLDRLLESHREIEEQAYDRAEPGLLFREAPPAYRFLREYYMPDVERIFVNQEDVLEQCRAFFNLYEPRSAAKVSLSKDGPLMFQRLGIETEVERLAGRKVSLPSGANFVIDQAEALVAIDVNSAKSKGDAPGNVRDGKGKSKGKRRGGHGDLEDTVFAVNMEAAQEIARQLRLRDLGGIIVVDFIDMEEDRHRRKVEEAMRRALSEDKAKIKVYDISPLGLMQISRQRLRKAGPNFTRTACEACQGRGWHASSASGALAVLRRLEDRMNGRQGRSLTVTVPFPVANYLLNDFRSHVLDLEKRYGAAVRILADASHAGEAVFAADQAQPGPAPQAGQAVQAGQGAAQPARKDAAQGGAGETRVDRDQGDRNQGDRNQGDRNQGRGQERGRGGRDRGDGRRRGRGRGEQEAARESSAPAEAREARRDTGIPEVHMEAPESLPSHTGVTEEYIAFAEAAPAPVEEPMERVEVPVPELESASDSGEAVTAEGGQEQPQQGRDPGERQGRRGRGRRGRGGRSGRNGQDGAPSQAPQEGRRPPQKEVPVRESAATAQAGDAPAKDGGRKGRGQAGRGPQGRGSQGEGSRRGNQAGGPQSRQPQPQAKASQAGNRPAEAPARGRGDRKAEPREAKPAAQGAGSKGGGKAKRGSRPQPAPAGQGAAPKSPRKGPIEY